MTDEEILNLSLNEYYDAFMGLLNDYPTTNGLTVQAMVERMLLHNTPFEGKVDALMAEYNIADAHQKKIREAFEWKRKQLQTRAAIFGNVN